MGRRTARDVARAVLRRVEQRESFVSDELDAALAESGLPPRDRALATELVYGVLRHRGRLDRALDAYARRPLRRSPPAVVGALRLGAYQILMLDRVPAHAAVDDAVGAARRVAGPRVGGFVNGLLRALERRGEPPLPDPDREPGAWLRRACSVPDWIAIEIERALPAAELRAAADALAQPAPLHARINPRRASIGALSARLEADHPGVRVEPVHSCPGALAITGLGDPTGSPSFRDGWWTVQDLGAQLVGHLAGVAPGMRVLDACAGVGGKATHLAELLDGQGRITAADRSGRKLARLTGAADRLGLEGIETRVADLAREPGSERWDRILLDAPCTGLGVLRRHPEVKWRVAPEDVDRMAGLQRRLLDALVPRLSPGGLLVYSVCTFTAAEGPGAVRAILEAHPELERAGPPDGAVGWAGLLDEQDQLRTWPHRHGADAFFAARLRRRT